MKYISMFVLFGICLFGYSLTLKPYTDGELFEKKYMSLSSGQSKEYFDLRDSMLTSKYRIQDTGITFFSISTLVWLIFKFGNNSFKSPRSTIGFVLLAICLPFISVSGYVFDLFQGMVRQDFPHWADSLGIPLAGVPIQLFILLFWSVVHLLFLRGSKISSQKVAPSKAYNFWLIFLSIITALLVFLCALYGQYWYAFPGVLWMYFYLSLAAVRVNNSIT